MNEYSLELSPISDLTALGYVKYKLRNTQKSIVTKERLIRKFENGELTESDGFTKENYENELSKLRSENILLSNILRKILNEKGAWI